MLPLTGVLAAYGQAQERGAQAAVARVNAEGGVGAGVGRRRVELLVRDTGSDPDVAAQNALILVRGPYQLLALLGPCVPPTALVRVAEARGIALLSGCAPAPELGPLERTWQVAPTEADRAAAVLTALGAQDPRRLALFLSGDRSDTPWRSGAASVGFELVGTYRAVGTSWREAVAAARTAGADVGVAVTEPPAGIALWRELRRQGLQLRSAYASEAATGTAWRDAVGTAGEATLTDLVHRLALAGGDDAADRAVTAVADELTSVLLGALNDAELWTRSAVQDALPGARGTVGGTPVDFGTGRTSPLPPALARWEDGALVAVP